MVTGMRPCPDCGELIAETANFCPMCGERITEEPPPPPRPLPQSILDEDEHRFPRSGAWFLVAAASLLILGVGAVLVLNDPEQRQQPPLGASPSGLNSPAPAPQDVLTAAGTVRLQVGIGNCEGCDITAVTADSSIDRTEPVVNGTAQFVIPHRSTLGLGFSVAHPQGFGEAGGPNVAVLSPLGAITGGSVSAATIADATSVGICWAGTVSPTASIQLLVEPHGDSTVTGGLRVWASPAQPILDAMVAPSGEGTVEVPALSTCSNAVRGLGG